MIKKIFLCGNTGSNNRGCEAIIQSTYDIIRDLNSDIPITLFLMFSFESPKQYSLQSMEHFHQS